MNAFLLKCLIPNPRYYSLTVAIALTLVLGSIALVWFWQQQGSVVSA
ncbi:MAG TPA: hypothetical protein VJ023_20710 [Pyrinomonadaceae bacterium]|nr:hypothetical protein [Pyrinomonadaceae bacterium]